MSLRSAEVGARVYAEALAAAAEGKGILDQVGDELKALIVNRQAKGSLIAAFFGSTAVRREQKAAKVESAVRGRMSDLFVDFLLVLLRRNRLELIDDVAKSYQQILDQRGAKVRVTLTTASDASESDIAAWQARLQPLLQGRQAILRHRKDPTLIGGSVLRTGDWVADWSVRRVLNDLKARLTRPGRSPIAG